MYNLAAFRERVTALYRRANPYEGGRRPTQQDLADAVGLSRSELSCRLNGLRRARLLPRDVHAIIRTLAEWEAITSGAEVRELLDLVDCPDFTAAEWQASPLADLIPTPALPPVSPTAPTSNLPHALSSFIGREQALSNLISLLTDPPADHRLLTITGTGGIGKTRLALETARRLLDAYPDGVWLIRLAALREPQLLPYALASILGIHEQPSDDLVDTISEYIGSRRLLLLLDNCEHLVAACARLTEALLSACPRLVILATSREALGLAGETDWRLTPLALPQQAATDLTSIQSNESVRLFVARASAANRHFALTTTNATVVAQICRRLDGIALALELAAALVKGLSIAKIADRLDDRFKLLTKGDRTAIPRHQTLRACIEWSYNLLDEAERAMLRRLAVFAGGFTLEAAEVVVTAPPISSYDVAALLVQLVEKSLVVREERDGEVRYFMLETIRQYAAELLFTDELADTQARHWNLFIALVENVSQHTHDRTWAAELRRLDREYDNLRAAISNALGADQIEVATRLAQQLGKFWEVRGYYIEGSEWLERVLAVAHRVPPLLRAKALNSAGVLALRLFNYPKARQLLDAAIAIERQIGAEEELAVALANLAFVVGGENYTPQVRALFEESLAIRRRLNDKWGIASALSNLGNMAAVHNDYLLAASYYQEALTLHRELGDTAEQAMVLHNLGATAVEAGDYRAARAYYQASLDLRRELNSPPGIASCLYGLGLVAYQEGDFVTARILFDQCLTMERELGNKYYIVYCLGSLGDIACQNDDFAAATDLYHQSLVLALEIGLDVRISNLLAAFAHLAHRKGQPQRAVILYAAAAALRHKYDTPLVDFERQIEEQDLAALRQQLDAVELARCQQMGDKLSMQAAAEYALSNFAPTQLLTNIGQR